MWKCTGNGRPARWPMILTCRLMASGGPPTKIHAAERVTGWVAGSCPPWLVHGNTRTDIGYSETGRIAVARSRNLDAPFGAGQTKHRG
jgi:hypothetical protein